MTHFGVGITSVVMILGYGVIAVPTGIVTVELSNISKQETPFVECKNCKPDDHDGDALFCKYCASSLKVLPEVVLKK